MKAPLVFLSSSPEETQYWGKRLGMLLKKGDVVALKGELGAGKTTLAQGIAQGVGVSEECYVTSPSFTLINEYQGKVPLYHFDFYRIKVFEELENLGLEEYFQGEGVSLIEWPEKIEPWLPHDYILVVLEYTDHHARTLSVSGRGSRFREVIREIERIVR